MTRRIAIGNYSGNFFFRVAKAGFDAVTSSLGNLILHEQLDPVVPIEQGSVTLAPGDGVTVNLQNTYSYYPLIILRCDKNYTAAPGRYMARFDRDEPTLKIYNRTDQYSSIPSETLTIKYFIFDRLGV